MSDFIDLISQKRACHRQLKGSKSDFEPWIASNIAGLFEETLISIAKSQSLYLFIDALDECPNPELKDLIAFFSSIDWNSIKNSIKVCMSSRPNQYVGSLSLPLQEKIFLEDENLMDIKKFSALRLEHLLNIQHDQDELIDALVSRANGLFLWVTVAVDLLAHLPHTNDIAALVQALPTGLENIYHSTFDRFMNTEQHSSELGRKVLTWIAFARRPLSVEELGVAIGLDEPRQSNLEPTLTLPLCFEKHKDWVKDHCWGLVEVRESNNRVEYIHQTARDFLLNSKLFEKFDLQHSKIGSAKSNLQLAWGCVKYLSLNSERYRVEKDPVAQGTNGFLDYATSYWTEHAKLADTPGLSHEILLQPLGWPSTQVLDHWACLSQKMYGASSVAPREGWTALHASAAYDLYHLTSVLLEVPAFNSHSVDILDSSGRTPLSWAACNGNHSIAQMLIERGASLDTRDSEYGNTPLHYAALKGHEKVVKLLLLNRANIDDRLGGSTALSLAAARGHKGVVAMLLDKNSDTSLRDMHYGCSPLHLAASYGHREVVSLLLNSRADVNAVDHSNYRTPLHYAILGGHHSIVCLLLNCGATVQNTNTCGRVLWQPLTLADRREHSLTRALEWHFASPTRDCSEPSGGFKGDYLPSGYNREYAADKTSGMGSGKRSRDISNSGPGGGGGGHGPGDEPKKNPKLNDGSASELKLELPCPYFKHDPGRYGSERSCRCPQSWPTVHRLKSV